MRTRAIDLRTGRAHASAKAARAFLRRDDRELRSDMNARDLGMSGRALRSFLRSLAFSPRRALPFYEIA